MEKCGILKHSLLVDAFEIGKLSAQDFPKIDPKFMELYGDEMGKCWTILNNQGVHHELIFNQVSDYPLVISGWSVLEGYYNFPTEVVVTVGYYSNNNFGIIGFKEVVRFEDLPVFHSRNIFHKEIYAFDITLSAVTVDRPRLKLQVDFATVLRDFDYEDVVLCGENGKTKMMTLFNVGDTHRTKIGNGWDLFCKDNNYKTGDRLQFRLDVASLKKTCHVYIFPYA